MREAKPNLPERKTALVIRLVCKFKKYVFSQAREALLFQNGGVIRMGYSQSNRNNLKCLTLKGIAIRYEYPDLDLLLREERLRTICNSNEDSAINHKMFGRLIREINKVLILSNLNTEFDHDNLIRSIESNRDHLNKAFSGIINEVDKNNNPKRKP